MEGERREVIGLEEGGGLGDLPRRDGLNPGDGLVHRCHAAVVEQPPSSVHREKLVAVGRHDQLAAVLLLVGVQAPLGQQVTSQSGRDAFNHPQA